MKCGEMPSLEVDNGAGFGILGYNENLTDRREETMKFLATLALLADRKN
jgi:hypothetical protein